jgi:hypothetical protein
LIYWQSHLNCMSSDTPAWRLTLHAHSVILLKHGVGDICHWQLTILILDAVPIVFTWNDILSWHLMPNLWIPLLEWNLLVKWIVPPRWWLLIIDTHLHYYAQCTKHFMGLDRIPNTPCKFPTTKWFDAYSFELAVMNFISSSEKPPAVPHACSTDENLVWICCHKQRPRTL